MKDWDVWNEAVYSRPLPRWRTTLARWLLTGKRQLSECSKHYDEYGMPNTNISGCVWCALEAYESAFRQMKEAAKYQRPAETQNVTQESK